MGKEKHTTTKKKWTHISEKDRYKIEALSQQGLAPAAIGRALCPQRDRRTIERELALGTVRQRNSDLTEKMVYLADAGQTRRDRNSANKGRPLKIGHDHKLARHIEDKIKNDRWSPDAIIGNIKAEGLRFETSICTKTLYNYIGSGVFAGVSNKDLWAKKERKKRRGRKARTVALRNRNGKSIDERPEGANDRTEAGHWEIDLVVGRQGTKPAILTLVERKTRKALYAIVKNKTQKETAAAIKRAGRRAGGSPGSVFKTFTADNASEFLDSEAIKKASGCLDVFYAHPYCSWERGSNENCNRMLRRFVPKGTDIGKLTHKELQRIEDWVNNYPRRILSYKTANDAAP